MALHSSFTLDETDLDYDDPNNSFLFAEDDIPFDEVPPEPGRQIISNDSALLLIQIDKSMDSEDGPIIIREDPYNDDERSHLTYENEYPISDIYENSYSYSNFRNKRSRCDSDEEELQHRGMYSNDGNKEHDDDLPLINSTHSRILVEAGPKKTKILTGINSYKISRSLDKHPRHRFSVTSDISPVSSKPFIQSSRSKRPQILDKPIKFKNVGPPQPAVKGFKSFDRSNYCPPCNKILSSKEDLGIHNFENKELHMMVSHDWWKKHAHPKDDLPSSEEIWCIICQYNFNSGFKSVCLESHLKGKRHTSNLVRWKNTFHNLPLHGWCMFREMDQKVFNKIAIRPKIPGYFAQ